MQSMTIYIYNITEKKKIITDRSRRKWVDVAAFALFAHATSHVRVAGKVQILQQNGVAAIFGDLKFDCGCFHDHIRFFWKTLDVIFQYYLFIAHFLRHFCWNFSALLTACFVCVWIDGGGALFLDGIGTWEWRQNSISGSGSSVRALLFMG